MGRQVVGEVMSEGDAWPQSRHALFNCHKKAAAAESHLQPSVPQEIINQIANQMDQTVPIQKPNEDMCQSMLASMPKLGSFGQSEPAENAYLDMSGETSGQNKELNGLLGAGYRPLNKNDGKWSEADSKDNTKLILE